MNIFTFFVTLMTICSLAAGCGGNGENECDKEAKIHKAGLDEGCAGRSEECWACKCYNQGQEVLVETGPVYSCVDKEQPEPCLDDPDTPDVDECACEGEALTSAQECLDDEDTCKQEKIASQNARCKNT